jgi:two-component system sensor histidine kinase TctE
MAGVVVGFNALLRRLEIAVDGMRRFTADASHQMRTPLAILRTHLAVLEKRGTEGPAGRQSLRDIKLAVERLQSLLTGLITLARTEEGAPGADLVDVDLQDLCRNIALALAPIATAARIDIHLDAAEQPVHLRTDPFLVTEMLTNLIDNAIRYNRRGGEVALGLSRAGDLVTLWVEDNGPGIAPKDHAEVLRRFHRLPRDQHQSGSGLGLSIVSAIAARLGGTLSLGPGAKGAGLRVEIAFPANS